MVGKHRPESKSFNHKEWKPVERNQDPRYEYVGLVPGVGKCLVVDFKDFFMVPCEFLYSELAVGSVKRLAEMESPYKEHLLQRFAWYLMRVGLPVDFHQLPAPEELAPGTARPAAEVSAQPAPPDGQNAT